MSKKTNNLLSTAGMIKELRNRGLSTGVNLEIAKSKITNTAVKDMLLLQVELNEEFLRWIDMAMKEIENPSPGWRQYIGNCQREAAELLEMIDHISIGVKYWLGLQEQKNKLEAKL